MVWSKRREVKEKEGGKEVKMTREGRRIEGEYLRMREGDEEGSGGR